ncbi:unnamed protein product, partial [marine sediment metagenome]
MTPQVPDQNIAIDEIRHIACARSLAVVCNPFLILL